MKLAYIFSLIALIATITVIPVEKKKSNMIFRIVFELILIMLVQIGISIIGYYINLPINLCTLSIIYIIFTVIGLVCLFKKNNIQEFEIKKGEIIFGIIASIILIGFAIFRYGYPFEIKYGTDDGAVHFSSAYNFMLEDRILIDSNKSIIKYFGTEKSMIGSYVNTGIFMDLLAGIISDNDMYQLYIVWDLIILWLSAIVMYHLIRIQKENKWIGFIAIAGGILYVLAYPLNSVIMGSAYLTLSLLFALAIIYWMNKKDVINSKVWYFVLGLLNLGILHSYILFSVVILISEIIFFIIQEKKNSWKAILGIIVLPIITLLIYASQLNEKIYIITTNGPMYKNYYSNLLLFIPMIIYNLWNEKKKKNLLQFENVLLLLNLITIIIVIVLSKNNIISSYYCHKFYSLFWISIFVISTKGLLILLEEKTKWAIIYLSISTVLFISSFLLIKLDFKIEEEMEDVTKETIFSFSEVYRYNYEKTKNSIPIMNKEELELLPKIKEIYQKENTQILGGMAQIKWCLAFVNDIDEKYLGKEEGLMLFLHNRDNIDGKYLICFKRSDLAYMHQENLLNEGYYYQYETKYGGILENNKEE